MKVRIRVVALAAVAFVGLAAVSLTFTPPPSGGKYPAYCGFSERFAACQAWEDHQYVKLQVTALETRADAVATILSSGLAEDDALNLGQRSLKLGACNQQIKTSTLEMLETLYQQGAEAGYMTKFLPSDRRFPVYGRATKLVAAAATAVALDESARRRAVEIFAEAQACT